MKLGVAVDASSQVIDDDGAGQTNLLIVGSLAREQDGELMEMPQVSAQPDAVARHVAQVLAA